MARTGRPPEGAKLVDRVEGSRRARERTKWILRTLSGERAVGEACDALGLSEAAFYKMRGRFLEEAVASLEPRTRGRKPAVREIDPSRAQELEEEVERLRKELAAARVREEIAVALPHVGKSAIGQKKKRRR